MKSNHNKPLFCFLLVVALVMVDSHASILGGFLGYAEDPAAAAGFTPYAGTDQAVVGKSQGLEERISLDLRNIEVTEALRFLAMKGGLNLAISKSVSGRLFLLLNDVPIKDFLDIILITNDLAYEKQGPIYHIMTGEEYEGRYGRKFSDIRKIKIFQLKYAIPERVFAAVDALKSEVGRVLVDQESGMVLVMDTDHHLEKITSAVDALESKRDIQVFPLKYAKAKDVEEQLKTQLDAKAAGSVISDERNNQIVVQTFPERMDQIATLIKSLDKKTKEVLIVAKIIRVTLSDDLATEIKWEGFFRFFSLFPFDKEATKSFFGSHGLETLARTGTSAVDDFVKITPTTRPTAQDKNTFFENLVLGQTDQAKSFEVLINFLKTIGETRVLSSPRITVVNNQEAKIHVGERQAYVTTTTTTGQSTSTTAEQVTFIDVGIQLAVTPTINDDGYVTMKVKPEISSVTSTLTTPSGNEIPIVDTSESESVVMVKDKTTIIIAGLRRDEEEVEDERIPYLSDIPGLGKLFRSGHNIKRRTELLVLLTPNIIGGETFVTGEVDEPAEVAKTYTKYSDLKIKPEKPVASRSNPVSGFFKKITFRNHE